MFFIINKKAFSKTTTKGFSVFIKDRRSSNNLYKYKGFYNTNKELNLLF